jgi:hypothetical protein
MPLLRLTGLLSNLAEGAVVAIVSVSLVAETAAKVQVVSEGSRPQL